MSGVSESKVFCICRKYQQDENAETSVSREATKIHPFRSNQLFIKLIYHLSTPQTPRVLERVAAPQTLKTRDEQRCKDLVSMDTPKRFLHLRPLTTQKVSHDSQSGEAVKPI